MESVKNAILVSKAIDSLVKKNDLKNFHRGYIQFKLNDPSTVATLNTYFNHQKVDLNSFDLVNFKEFRAQFKIYCKHLFILNSAHVFLNAGAAYEYSFLMLISLQFTDLDEKLRMNLLNFFTNNMIYICLVYFKKTNQGVQVNPTMVSDIIKHYLAYAGKIACKYQKNFHVAFQLIIKVQKSLSNFHVNSDQTVIDLINTHNNAYDGSIYTPDFARELSDRVLKDLIIKTYSDIKDKITEIDHIFEVENFFCFEKKMEREIFSME